MKQVHAQINCIMNIIILFNNKPKKISNCRALPGLLLAPFSSKVYNYHLHVNDSGFSKPHLTQIEDHSFTYLTYNISPFGCFTTPQISNSEPFTFKRNISSKVVNSQCLPPSTHLPCTPPFFAGFFPHLSNIQL